MNRRHSLNSDKMYNIFSCNYTVVLKVAQYIKFELPVLQGFISKLQEEEEREMQKLKRRYLIGLNSRFSEKCILNGSKTQNLVSN